MKRFILFMFMFFLMPGLSFGQQCSTSVDGHARCNFDLNEFSGIPAPSVSPSGKGRMYFDNSANTFKCSEDGAAYENCVGGGGGSGTMTTVKENNVGVGGADIVTIDFLGADFNLTESPDKEVQIVIEDGGVDHDATANFVAAEHVTEASISHDTIAGVSTSDHHTQVVSEVNKDIVTTAPLTGAEDNVLPGADADLTLAITVLKDIVTTAPITGGENDVLTGGDADLTISITVAKDIVTTAPITGGEDNVLTGADADLTIAIDVLKDLVTTAPITGGTDNIFPGSDSDITVAITVLKDLVTTAPITGGTNDILTGSDSDVTIAITVAKDIVAGVGLSGGEDNVLTGSDADTTLTLDLNELGNETAIASGDFICMVDITDSGSQKITFANIESTISHDSIADVSTSDHHTATTATVYNEIVDPTGAGDIVHADTETAKHSMASDGETAFTIDLIDTDLAGDTIALLLTAVDNDDTNYIPLRIADDSGGDDDMLFQIGSLGQATIGGATGFTLSAAIGIITMAGIGNTNNEDTTIDLESVADQRRIASGTGIIETFVDGDIILLQEGDSRTVAISDDDPHLRVYSSDTAQSIDWVEIYHNQSAAIFESGTSELHFISTAGTIIFKAGASAGLTVDPDPGQDQLVFGIIDGFGNQLILANNLTSFRDFDHPLTTNPTYFIQSDLDPNVSNNQWGSSAHNQVDFIIETGVNVGTGSGATTIENGIQFHPRGTLAVTIDGDGGLIPKFVTADPCGSMGEGSIFYNSTANQLCYCSASSADLKIIDDAACF